MKAAERFSLTLDLACAAVAVLLSGHIADDVLARMGNREAPIKRFTPLYEEFSDVLTGRKFGNQLKDAAFPDLPAPRHYERSHQSNVRLYALLRISVMPSVIVAAIARHADCDPASRRPALREMPYSLHAASLELSIDRALMATCWNTSPDIDLDRQWHAIRAELLRMRGPR